MSRTALVVGATGLVGGELVKLLLADADTERVVAFTRRPLAVADARLEAQLVDFRDPASFADRVRGDVLFSALGSTKKKAGSDAARYEVDHTFQLAFAAAASRNGVGTYALVSAMGASPSSSSFYLRMRGELERDVQALPFPRLRILRPGMLDGEREESRPAEHAAVAVLRWVGRVPGLKAVRPIDAALVARALLAAAADPTPGVLVRGGAELFDLAASWGRAPS